MIGVRSGRTLRRLAYKSLLSAKSRNAVAVAAIALTTLLFTVLTTLAISVNDSIQESNFRQVGGYAHGSFKYLSEEQFDELCTDPLIVDFGKRRTLAHAEKPPFHKIQLELSYCDDNEAKWMFLESIEGRFPQEGTREAATDLRVLSLLGIEPVLGQEFTVSFDVEGQPFTESFTLCGWWEYDPACIASHILLPSSRVEELLACLPEDTVFDRLTGSYTMDLMLGSTLHIARDMEEILTRHGYQNREKGDDYIASGVNWAYSGAQLSSSFDGGIVAAGAALLLLVILTGYLIINNVFRISVQNDIRGFGLLKTVGTTSRQLGRIVRYQALLLSLLGLPVGLLLGWLAGGMLVPLVLERFSFGARVVSVKPVIFLSAALFALATVLLSCMRPARMAAKVSPIEALRYVEISGRRKATLRRRGLSLFTMAWSNLQRSRAKTALTLASLALSVVLLTVTVTFTNGFDMDKYLRNVPCDFQIADASYFRSRAYLGGESSDLPQGAVDELNARGMIADGGLVYGGTGAVREYVSEDYFRSFYGRRGSEDAVSFQVFTAERNDEGNLGMNAQLYGMEEFVANKLTVLEGDISKLYDDSGNYIAAVYGKDDYNQPRMDSHWAKLGDTVTLRYVSRFEFFDPETGNAYADDVDLEAVSGWSMRAAEYTDISYTVAALVTIPNSLNYRYYGSDEFILSDSKLLGDAGSGSIMYYAFDLSDEADAQSMESFLKNYTSEVNTALDYESKISKSGEFESFRAMFLILGSAMSFIVGLVGVLNFFNTVLTGVVSRRREFAVMQSVGMTGRQLKQMLVYEGLFYALGAVAASLILTLLLAPMVSRLLESMFWFYSYRLTLMPLLIVTPVFVLLGVAIPLLVYRSTDKRSIVQCLREAES